MNAISKRAVTRKGIQNSIEASVLKGCGIAVQVGMLGNNLWSLYGDYQDIAVAMGFLSKAKFVTETGVLPASDGKFLIHFKTGA